MSNSAKAQIMDGTTLARRLLDETSERSHRFAREAARPPCLAAVLVGEDPASIRYVKMKRSRCEEAGLASRLIHLPTTSTTAQVVGAVTELSADTTVDGILLQHPVPPHIDERSSYEAIVPEKDVDGVTAHSFAAMALGLPGFASCAPAGIVRLLDEYDIDPTGLHAVVIGHSAVLGKPMGMLLLERGATVTFCQSHSRDLPAIVRSADLVVAAVGQPNFVAGGWLKPGVVVIDAGYFQGATGDVNFREALPIASFITPVPGGVGPMTIALLLEQTVVAAERRMLRLTD